MIIVFLCILHWLCSKKSRVHVALFVQDDDDDDNGDRSRDSDVEVHSLLLEVRYYLLFSFHF